MDKIDSIVRETNFAKIGMVISVIVLLAGLFPKNFNIDLWELTLNIFIPIDSWAIIFLGLSLFFYFTSIRANQHEKREGNMIVIDTFDRRTKLSEELRGISIFAIILFIFRGGYLILVNLN